MKRLKRKLELRYLCVLLSISIIFSYEKTINSMSAESPVEESIPTVEEPPSDLSAQAPQTTPIPSSPQAGTPSAAPSQELDTMSISTEKTGEQGNWVKKKNWLLKSYEINNNIYNLAIQIEQTKKVYKEKYNSIDAELDKFYKDLGIEQGKLQEMFESVERYLEKKKKKGLLEMTSQTEKLNAPEKELRKKMEILESQIAEMKDELKQLGLNMEAISDVDKSLTARLQKVDEQITIAMTNAEAAKTKVESLWDIIDDKKARDVYYEVLNIESNLKAILDYLKDVLAKDFDNVVQTTKTQITSANSGIKTLENKGLIIKDRSRRVEQLKVAELQKTNIEEAQQQTKALGEVTSQKELGFTQKIYNFIISVFTKTYIFIKNLFSKQTEPAKQEQQPSSNIAPLSQEGKAAPSIPNLSPTTSILPDQSQNAPSLPPKIPLMPTAEPTAP